jgi:transposase
MQLKNYAEQQEADDMYKMMFGVEDLDIRRKKPVRNEDVSRTLNEGSEHGGEETFENPKPIIENMLKNMTSP